MPDLYIFMGSRWHDLIETYPDGRLILENAPYRKHPEVDKFNLWLIEGNDPKKSKEHPEHILPIYIPYNIL